VRSDVTKDDRRWTREGAGEEDRPAWDARLDSCSTLSDTGCGREKTRGRCACGRYLSL
jgi:hypothetical protein